MSFCTFAAVSNMNMCLRDPHALDLLLHQSDLATEFPAGVTIHQGIAPSLGVHSGDSSFHDGHTFDFKGRLAIGEPAVLLGVYTQRHRLAKHNQGAALRLFVLSTTLGYPSYAAFGS
jgi:hypothetical protein